MFYSAPASAKFHLPLLSFLLLLALGGPVRSQGVNSPRPNAAPVQTAAGSNREQDGLTGPVRRVRTEIAKLTLKDGKPVEAPRVLLEMTTYDRSGTRVDNSIFAVSSISLVGKEIYKYDAKGNIVEMTVRGDDGSIVSQEVYAYEFDAVGNWKKMTTSVALIENGDITYEPTEVTYRTIAYYLTDDVAKVIKSPTPPINAPEPTPTVLPAKKEAPEEKAAAQNPGKAVGEAVQLAAGQSAIPADRTQASEPPVSATPVPQVSETADPVETDRAKEGGGTKKEEPPVTKKEEPSARKEEPPAAEPPAPKPPVKPVSGGVLNGKAIVLPLPAYTEVAKRAGDQGTVSVEVVIDVTGKVISAKAVSGPGTLRRVAEDAARRAQFSPTLLSGQPLRITGVINYNFTLKQ